MIRAEWTIWWFWIITLIMFLRFLMTLVLTIWNDFTRVSSFHKYNTRGSPYNFVVPLAKGQARFTFNSTAIHHWNSLPNEIKSNSDFNVFKKLVKKHLVDHTSIGYWAGLIVICLCFLISSVLPFSFVMFLSTFSSCM